MRKTFVCLLSAAAFGSSPALAGPEAFRPGPVIANFGPAASNEDFEAVSPEARFRIAYDVSALAPEDGLNRTLEAAARFLNMHARAGVPTANMSLAVVVHGKAVFDVAHPRQGGDAANPNAALVAALTSAGVRIIVCGQSAAFYDVAKADLLPGVELSLSAMTSHALLQQEGYTLNPF